MPNPVTPHEDADLELLFPGKGIDTSTEFELQPGLTTPEGVNVRLFESTTHRGRGGSRIGLSKLLGEQVEGDHPVQMLNFVAIQSEEALLADDGQQGQSLPGEDGSTGGGGDGEIDDSTDTDYAAGLRRRPRNPGGNVRKRGTGVRPKRQRDQTQRGKRTLRILTDLVPDTGGGGTGSSTVATAVLGEVRYSYLNGGLYPDPAPSGTTGDFWWAGTLPPTYVAGYDTSATVNLPGVGNITFSIATLQANPSAVVATIRAAVVAALGETPGDPFDPSVDFTSLVYTGYSALLAFGAGGSGGTVSPYRGSGDFVVTAGGGSGGSGGSESTRGADFRGSVQVNERPASNVTREYETFAANYLGRVSDPLDAKPRAEFTAVFFFTSDDSAFLYDTSVRSAITGQTIEDYFRRYKKYRVYLLADMDSSDLSAAGRNNLRDLAAAFVDLGFVYKAVTGSTDAIANELLTRLYPGPLGS